MKINKVCVLGLLVLISGCNKDAERFPGFTPIANGKEPAKFFIDTKTLKRNPNGVISFNMVRVLEAGYAIQNAITDCKTSFESLEGVKFKADGSSDAKFIAEKLAIPNQMVEVNALVKFACDKAEENRLIIGVFDDVKALEILYGAYQPTTKTAHWENMNPPVTLEGYGNFLGKSGSVKILDSKDFIQEGKTKHILLTSTSITDSTEVLLNAAVFVKIDDKWHEEAEYPYLKIAKNGEPKVMRWEHIGKEHYGISEAVTAYSNPEINEENGKKYYKKDAYFNLYELKENGLITLLQYSRSIEYSENTNLNVEVAFPDLSQDYSYTSIMTGEDEEKLQIIYQYQNGKYVPLWMNALQELFGITDASGKIKTEKDKLSSVWFEQSFKHSRDNIHVVFMKTTFDGGHSDGAKISAITYNNIAGKLTFLSKQKNFSEIGSFGVAPEIGQADFFELTPDKPVFLVADHFQQMGYEITSKKLFLFSKNNWVDLGFIIDEANNNAANVDEKENFSYQGKISAIKSDKDYPDLLVTKTGTEHDDKFNVIPAKNDVYVFNGKKYELKP